MIYDPEKLLLLAGPCSLESLDICRPVADALASLQAQHPELSGTLVRESLPLLGLCEATTGILLHQLSQIPEIIRVQEHLRAEELLQLVIDVSRCAWRATGAAEEEML